MAIVEDFLVNNASVLEKLRVAETVNVEDLEVITTGAETKSKNISKKAKNVDAISEQIANIDEEMEDEGLDDEHEGAEKRFITAEVQYNFIFFFLKNFWFVQNSFSISSLLTTLSEKGKNIDHTFLQMLVLVSCFCMRDELLSSERLL